jgi:single-strand DNA-binding protein
MHLAVSRKFRTKDGQDREEACFVGIVVWGRQAENCGKYLNKGSQILVEGRLQFEQWEKDGQKQSRLRVRADNVQFMGRPQATGDRPDSRPSDVPPQPSAPSDPMPEPAGGDDDNLPF